LIALLTACCFYFSGGLPKIGTTEAAESAAAAAAENSSSQTGADDHVDDHDAHHTNPVTDVLIAIVLILLCAKVGGDLFERMGQPAVLGELTVGVILGNFTLLTGWDVLEPLFKIPHELPELASANLEELLYNPAAVLKILASMGVILLLFEVGLESTVREMMSVGVSSMLVAVLGVVAPFGLGWLVGWLIIPEQGWQVHAFIGATLCATSVGITARVLKDIGCSQRREARIILGAAVVDDVLGLVILAVVSDVISSGSVEPADVLLIIGKAFGFLLGAVAIGNLILTRPIFKAASYLRGRGLLVSSALVICFSFSWLAALVGLEPIVGAFAAGLILERAHYRELGDKEHYELEDALAPLSALLVPIFFVQMGTQVDLASFAKPSLWGLAAAITATAVIGKQICAFGVREPGLNSLAVGLGMIPRGEVGLIFAEVGRNLTANGKPVINTDTFSAVVVMVMITTMLTPPLLKWSLTRKPENSEPAATGDGQENSPPET
jgi:Kef-type K+ transport system membrane component KefB